MVLDLVSVLWDQVVIPQLGQKYARAFHTRHFDFVTAEKLQQVFILQRIDRVHRQLFCRKQKENTPLKRPMEIPHANQKFT